MSKTALVIAPHADDEVLGCGGTIARHAAQGDLVHVVVITQGIPDIFSGDLMKRIHNEMREAHKILGIHSTRVLEFPAPKLDMIPGYEIADAISNIVREVKPDVVYLPHRGDLHTDHKKVYTATLVATRPVNGCSVERLLCYETLSETDWGAPESDKAFIPTVFINITDYLQMKLRAMECYQSQLKPFPNSRSLESLNALAVLRGRTVGFEAAEAFMLVREVDA